MAELNAHNPGVYPGGVSAADGHGAEGGHTHQYHLVNPSPWPLLGAFSAGLMAVGGVMYMHGSGWLLAALGFLCVLTVMAGWWRDVVRESVHEKAHTPIVKLGLRYGMSLFIASEVMFFAAFFWAFFDASLYPKEAIGGVWPPENIETFNAFHLPLMMTLILLLSGTTVTWAHHAIVEGDRKTASVALGLTVILGILFSCFQVYEYSHAHFGFSDGIYPSTFFMATGFHGFHVLIGTIFLAVCWFRVRSGHFTPKSHFGFEAAAWYWHFVDVVWLFLFVSIYWWGA
ncbi:cytochrome B562 [Skermanella aerolata]|uniref:Cytochrome c oxidase subunit 3 n=1 Tax=Skermanella aerolata TaxID=393310 RepID=A0A512DQU3_9PROT|nr:cytochrome c oxidase subunit 3 [Skermanella aerolata]KJB92740.1 cytochrome B562 [Skermanella aerolata KACC 11604]GEO38560.1 cytochrome B562 [Skermanella aerolata]